MIVFLEGLPGVGKSTIITTLQKRGIQCVNEIILDSHQSDNHDSKPQDFFMQNDNEKLQAAVESSAPLVVVDRGPLSTLAYNFARHAIDSTFDFMPVVTWFTNLSDIFKRSDVKVVYLKGHSSLPYDDARDPYGSADNQQLLEKITLDLLDIFAPKASVTSYDYEKNHEDIIDEILN